jgi:CheY-like chemotaxis protein
MKKLKTILLVEDNAMDVELTLEALGSNHLANRVVVARDGVAALEYLFCEGAFAERPKDNPAAILLDIKMPRMDGIEVLERIRADRSLKSVPVVMLTSSREEPDLKRCYEAGANAFVVKPVDFKEFIDAVRNTGVFWAMINEVPPDGGGIDG